MEYVLDVVEIIKGVDESHDLIGIGLTRDRGIVLGQVSQLGIVGRDLCLSQGLADVVELGEWSQDLVFEEWGLDLRPE